jgi:hypothetical protein
MGRSIALANTLRPIPFFVLDRSEADRTGIKRGNYQDSMWYVRGG